MKGSDSMTYSFVLISLKHLGVLDLFRSLSVNELRELLESIRQEYINSKYIEVPVHETH